MITCIKNNGADLQANDPLVPPAGQGMFYLYRVVGCGGQVGTYDSGAPSQHGSRDPGIQASAAACP
jgi:hypothetical protein